MRTLRLALVTVSLAACSRGTSAPTIGSSGPGTGPAPGLFAALFADDRALVYDVKRVSSYWDDQDPKADATGNVTSEETLVVTCQRDVEAVGRYRVARVTCDDADGDPDTFSARVVEQLEGLFVTDGQGLWRTGLVAMPTTEAAVDAARSPEPFLTVDQRPVKEEEQGSDGPDFGSRYEVTASGDGWCVAEMSWGGDEGGSGWCVSAAGGLVSASWFFAGGSSQDETATLRR